MLDPEELLELYLQDCQQHVEIVTPHMNGLNTATCRISCKYAKFDTRAGKEPLDEVIYVHCDLDKQKLYVDFSRGSWYSKELSIYDPNSINDLNSAIKAVTHMEDQFVNLMVFIGLPITMVNIIILLIINGAFWTPILFIIPMWASYILINYCMKSYLKKAGFTQRGNRSYLN